MSGTGTSVSQLGGGMQMTPQQQQAMAQQHAAQQQAMAQQQQAMAQAQQQGQQQGQEQFTPQQQAAMAQHQQAMMAQHAQQQMMEGAGEEEVNDILHDLQQQHGGGAGPQMNEGFSNMGINGIQAPGAQALPNSFNGVVDMIKEPLSVSALYVILNLSFVDELLNKYLGSFIGENGASSIKGVVLKALLIGVLYYVVSKFML